MQVQVIKGFVCRDKSGRMVYPVIGDIVELTDADAKSLEARGSVIILTVPEPEPTPVKRVPKKVL